MVLYAAALLAFSLWRPGVFPLLVKPFLFALDALDGPAYRLESFRCDGSNLSFSGVSEILTGLTTARGEAGPRVAFTATWDAYALHLYPVIVFSIVLVLPTGALRKGLTVLLALALCALAAAVDARTNMRVAAAKAVIAQWTRIVNRFPPTPANLDAGRGIQASFARFSRTKAALNAGGRLFLALLIAALAALPALPGAAHSPRPATPESAADPPPADAKGATPPRSAGAPPG